MLTLATSDINHIKPILLKSGYSSILCFKTTLNSSKFLVLILALFLCAHHISMPSAEIRIKVALKRELAHVYSNNNMLYSVYMCIIYVIVYQVTVWNQGHYWNKFPSPKVFAVSMPH